MCSLYISSSLHKLHLNSPTTPAPTPYPTQAGTCTFTPTANSCVDSEFENFDTYDGKEFCCRVSAGQPPYECKQSASSCQIGIASLNTCELKGGTPCAFDEECCIKANGPLTAVCQPRNMPCDGGWENQENTKGDS